MTEPPAAFRVADKQRETRGHVDAAAPSRPTHCGAPTRFAPGQFAMLYAFGVGEAPISVSAHRRRRRRSCTPCAPSGR